MSAASANRIVGRAASVGLPGRFLKAHRLNIERDFARPWMSLSPEDRLRDAELSLVQAQHDEYVGEATLLNAIGRLEVRRLVRGVEICDPAKNLTAVRKVGSVPWEPLVEIVDGFGSPSPRPDSASGFKGAVGEVAMLPAEGPGPTAAPLSTIQPTAIPSVSP